MISIADIVDTLANDFPSWRTLSDVRPHLRDGRPIYVTGNAAVTFFVRHKGREKILKCYTRDNPHLATIYGDAFRPRELRVFNMMNRSDFVDCLLTDRIEGISSTAPYVRRHPTDSPRWPTLSTAWPSACSTESTRTETSSPKT